MSIPSAATEARVLYAFVTLLIACAVLLCGSTAYAQADPAPADPAPAPAPAASPTLSNDGIFGCLGQGAQVQNVGTRAALGGVYVPVNDAAVTINTGFLVYKECILDGTARKIAENAAASMSGQGLRAVLTSKGGGPQFETNALKESQRQGQIIIYNNVTANARVICPAFRGAVTTAAVRTYLQRQNKPEERYTCTLPTDPNASYWSRLAALRQPRNNPLGAQLIYESQLQATLAYNEGVQRERLLRNNGFYDAMDTYDDPLNANIITPGYIIAQSLNQMTGSGLRQLENANEIDQVVSNLFGGLTTQLVSDTRGLVGLAQSANGQPSYLDRMVSQTSASVRTQAANAALAVIGAARQIEVSYRQAKEGTATALSNAIEKLRAAETQCWALIVPQVQARAAGAALQIATTTQASQAVIDANIAPLATTTVRDIRNSDSALATLNQLIASVSNSSSQANQQQALLRLDTLVANRQLHTTIDANNAVQQRDAVATALTKLVDDTIKTWGDDMDPNIGWCNVNNPAVIERWYNAWRQ